MTLYNAQRIHYTGDVVVTSLTVKRWAQASRVECSPAHPPKRVRARNKAKWRCPPLYTFTKLRFPNRSPLLAISRCGPALTCRQSKEFLHNYLKAWVGRVKVGVCICRISVSKAAFCRHASGYDDEMMPKYVTGTETTIYKRTGPLLAFRQKNTHRHNIRQ